MWHDMHAKCGFSETEGGTFIQSNENNKWKNQKKKQMVFGFKKRKKQYTQTHRKFARNIEYEMCSRITNGIMEEPLLVELSDRNE